MFFRMKLPRPSRPFVFSAKNPEQPLVVKDCVFSDKIFPGDENQGSPSEPAHPASSSVKHQLGLSRLRQASAQLQAGEEAGAGARGQTGGQ